MEKLFNIRNIHDKSYNDLIKEIIENKALENDNNIETKLLKKIILSYNKLSFELKEKIEEVTLLSITDPLTKIFNRLKFNDELEKNLNYVKRYKENLSIIMFDIDHFKKVNDFYGHDIGDEVLKILTNLIKMNIRKTDVFARWGGEEFILLVPKTNVEIAFELAEKLRKLIEKTDFPKVKNVTCSFGVCEYNNNSTEKFLKNVDLALYKAKENGRNQVIVYSDKNDV